MTENVTPLDGWERPGLVRPSPDHPSDPSKPPYIVLTAAERRRLRAWIVIVPESGCLGWGGPLTRDGAPAAYGMGRFIPAANLLLADMGVPVARRTVVERTCGTVTCMSPVHLHPVFDPGWDPWPLPQEPVVDLRFGRSRTRKLSDDQVFRMRHSYSWGGVSVSRLAREHAVAQHTVTKVLCGETYKDVTTGTDVHRRDATPRLMVRNGNPAQPGLHYRARLTPETVRWIMDHYQVESTEHMAEHLGVSRSTVAGVLSGRTWRHITGGRMPGYGPGRAHSASAD